LEPLKDLQSLQTLNCDSTQITDLEPLKDLQSLQSLNCDSTQITDLEPLKDLQSLQTLNCDSTQITGLEPLRDLQSLQTLHCDSTQITDLEPLKDLQSLQTLNCSSTQITDLEPLKDLRNLKELRCSHCRLRTIDESLLRLQSLNRLILQDTRIPAVPAEVLSQRYFDSCLSRVRAHFDDLRAGHVSASRAKLIVVGNGRVGKTQICRRLMGQEFDEAVPSTHGITVSPTVLPTTSGEDLQLKLWDFGGQDIYHGTHGLFMRTRAIFLACWTPRLNKPDEFELEGIVYRNYPLSYWIEYVRHLSGKATPLTVVQTQADTAADDEPLSAEENGRLETFTPKPAVIEYSAKEDRRRGTLNESIEEAARWLRDEYGTAVIGKGRMAVLERIETLYADDEARAKRGKPKLHRTMSMEDFERFCEEAKGGVSSPEHLLSYLHNAGVVYHDKERFEGRIIVDQAWALDAIYTVFDRDNCVRHLRYLDGRFTRSLLETLAWSEYSGTEQELFLSFMESCGIAFAHREGRPDERPTEYISPDLLPEFERVSSKLEGFWDDGAESAGLALDYPLLHGGLMRTIISRIGSEAQFNATYWQNGVCFYDGNTRSKGRIEAETREVWKGTITIRTQEGRSAKLLENLLKIVEEAENNLGLKHEPLENEIRHPDRPIEHPDEAPESDEVKPAAVPHSHKRRCVSYAWGDDTDEGRIREKRVDELCDAAREKGIEIIRDKTAMDLGDSISTFMDNIGSADQVYIVLSEKYLHSPYCMYELFQVWNYRRRDREELRKTVKVYCLDCVRIDTVPERLKIASFWQDQYEEINAIIKERGPGLLGEDSFKSYRNMQEFSSQIDNILAFVKDTLRPKTFEEFIKTEFDMGD
ncbi:MAG: leucine-rich repeat domain-containing protein, partial [Pseudomonadota bacterium]